MDNAQQPVTISSQELMSNIIARQRDGALNQAAQLEVQLAIALQENANLKAQVELLQQVTGSSTAAPTNRAQRHAKK